MVAKRRLSDVLKEYPLPRVTERKFRRLSSKPSLGRDLESDDSATKLSRLSSSSLGFDVLADHAQVRQQEDTDTDTDTDSIDTTGMGRPLFSTEMEAAGMGGGGAGVRGSAENEAAGMERPLFSMCKFDLTKNENNDIHYNDSIRGDVFRGSGGCHRCSSVSSLHFSGIFHMCKFDSSTNKNNDIHYNDSITGDVFRC